MKPTVDRESRNARDIAFITRIRQGDNDAIEELLGTYKRLLDSQTLRYLETLQKRDPASTRDDLLQVARIGFLRAVRDFDPELNVPFIIYAMQWMRSYVGRYMRRAGLITPMQGTELRTTEQGRAAVERYKRQTTHLAELDRPLRDADGSATLGDILPDGGVHRGVEESVLRAMYLRDIMRFASLSKGQKEVVEAFLTGNYASGTQASEMIGYSKQIWVQTLEKLRAAGAKLEALNGQ